MDSQIFLNVYNQIQMFWTPLIWISYFVGFILIINAIYKIAENNQRGGNESIGGHITLLVIGLFFTNMTFILDVITFSVFGNEYGGAFTSNSSGFRASVSATETQVKNTLLFVVAAIKFIGFLGIWRGLYMIKDKGRQEGHSFAGGMTHIMGGILALNFELTAQMVAATVGGDFANYIMKYF